MTRVVTDKILLLKENDPERSAAYKQLYSLSEKLLPRKCCNKKLDILCNNSAYGIQPYLLSSYREKHGQSWVKSKLMNQFITNSV